MPTYNRPATLRRCVEAVLCQTVRDIEVIVVDDGGAASAEQTLSEVNDPRLRVLRQANAGPAAARNRGASHSSARWLAFVDDDCAPRPDWLERLLGRATADPRAMGSGA